MSGSISIVIPCLNEADHLPRALEAIARQDLRPFEVLVVDAGSDDGSPALVEAYATRHPELGVRVIRGNWNAIPAVLNAGIEAAKGDIIVRLDGHSVPAPDYLRRVTLALDETRAGVAGGIWRVVPGAETTVARAIACAVSHPLGAGDAVYRIAKRATGRTSVDTVPFGCFRRETWERLGGFNEGLLTNEDYEFNYRVRSSGLQVVLDSSVECEYVARSTLSALARQYFRYGWWKAQMLKANPASLRLRQAIPALFAPVLVALAIGSFFSQWIAYTLLTLLVVYGATIGGAALHLVVRKPEGTDRGLGIRGAPPLTAALAIVHVVWSVGGLVNVITRGQWPPWRRRRRPIGVATARGFTLVQLLLSLSAILCLMLAPPALAYRVHTSRIAAAHAQVEEVAARVRASRLDAGVDVLAGPGRSPEAPGQQKWIAGTQGALPAAAADPWGNRLLMNVAAHDASRAVWVISAGPNGIIETPFDQPAPTASPGGDDIAARVR